MRYIYTYREKEDGRMSTFTAAGYYEGREQRIDTAKFDPETGIYSGEIHHALVWPETEEEKEQELTEGPWVMFAGHSFTGLWDSAYYYLRELARDAGIRLHVAYSYWGGTGIAHYAGLVPGCEERAVQAGRVFAANDHYDYCIFAGNSDEAVATASGRVGAEDYSQRERMLEGAHILAGKAAQKGAETILWVPQAYRYGFFHDQCRKPAAPGRVGDTVEIDGRAYTYTMDNRQFTEANLAWYRRMAASIGGGCRIAPIAAVYRKMLTDYPELVDPYLPLGTECGDMGHQNNLGNYIGACVLFGLILGRSPEGLGIPASHTFGMGGGAITPEQAAVIQREAWRSLL